MALSTNSKELLNIGTINRIELVTSSARVTSAKFHKSVVGRERQRPGPIDRTPFIVKMEFEKMKIFESIFLLSHNILQGKFEAKFC